MSRKLAYLSDQPSTALMVMDVAHAKRPAFRLVSKDHITEVYIPVPHA
jgi:hypothetical protein